MVVCLIWRTWSYIFISGWCERRQWYRMASGAERKTVEVEAVRKGRSFILILFFFVPKGLKKPVPAFVLVCNRRNQGLWSSQTYVKPFLSGRDDYFQRGYTCAAFRTQEVAPDYEDGFTTGFHRLFPGMPRQAHLAKEAGKRPVVRLMLRERLLYGPGRPASHGLFWDRSQINRKQVAVVGHSRGGRQRYGVQHRMILCHGGEAVVQGNSGDALARGSKESA